MFRGEVQQCIYMTSRQLKQGCTSAGGSPAAAKQIVSVVVLP